MFKNLKQKLENLSATSPSSKNTSMDELTEKPVGLEEDDDKQTTLSAVEKGQTPTSVDGTRNKTSTVSEQKVESTTETVQGHILASQSGKIPQDQELSDLGALSGEELDLTKANRVLLGQVKELKDSKAEIQRKFHRRIGELQEQIGLDKQAKMDLEHSYALMLDEKDELITVLKTQVQLLKSSHPVSTVSADMPDEANAETSEPSDSPISPEEAVILKEKVKRLESLLTKCKDTIKSNKEKTRQLTQEREELKRDNEAKINELQSKHEKELKSKMSDQQEEIRALSEVRSGLNTQLVELTSKLSEKETNINMKEKEFNAQMEKVRKDMEKLNATFQQREASFKAIASKKTSSEGPSNDGVEKCPVVDSKTSAAEGGEVSSSADDADNMKEMYELRSKELLRVLEDRNRLRKELAEQRQRFAAVLERYDEQMKVVQDELIEKMKPGPVESGLTQEVRGILSGNWSSLGEPEETKTGDLGEEATKPEESEKTKSSKSDTSDVVDKQDTVPRRELEDAELKIARILLLLEKCAKQLDSNNAMDNKWKERVTEAENKSATQLRESQETITRLNNQIMELTNRENLLNANLERARQESDAIFSQQTTEMASLQSTVEQLLQREGQIKGQMTKTQMTCESEVARVTAENMESLQQLTDMFQENQKAVSDLSGELLQSKEQSDEIILALERDLDEKCRMLQATADLIEADGDNAIKSAFMKIIVECSGNVEIPVEVGDSKRDEVGVVGVDRPSDVDNHVGNNNNGEVAPGIDNISVDNIKSSVTGGDKKEVKIESCNQQELIDFDFLPIERHSKKDCYREAPGIHLSNVRVRESGNSRLVSNFDVITRFCSRKALISGQAMPTFNETLKNTTIGQDQFATIQKLEKEVQVLKGILANTQEKCRQLETENASLVKTCEVRSTSGKAGEECSGSHSLFRTVEESLVSESSIEDPGHAFEENTIKLSELDSRKDITEHLETSKENMSRSEETTLKLEAGIKSSKKLIGTISDGEKNATDVEVENRSLQKKLYHSEIHSRNAETYREELEKENRDLKEDCKRLGKINKKLEQLLAEKGHSTDELDKLQMECEVLRSRVVYLESEVKGYKETKSNVSLHLENETKLSKSLDLLQLENSELKEKVEQYETRLKEMDLLRDKLVKSESLCEEVEQKCTNVKEELSQMQSDLDREKARSLMLEEEAKMVENLRMELRRSLEKIGVLEGNLSLMEAENWKLKDNLTTCELKLSNEREGSIKVEEDGKKMKEDLKREVLRIKSLEEQINRYQNLEVELEFLKKQETSQKELVDSLGNSLKDKETSLALKESMESSMESLRKECVEFQVTVTALKETIKMKESENISLLEKLKSKDVEVEELVRVRGEGMKNYEMLEDKVIHSEELLVELEFKHASLTRELREKIENVTELEGKLKCLSEENKLLSDSERIDEKNRLLDNSFNALTIAQKMLQRAAIEISELEGRVDELFDKIEQVNDRSEDKTMTNSLLMVTKELDVAKKDLKMKEDELQECEARILSGKDREEKLFQELESLGRQLVLRHEDIEELTLQYKVLVEKCKESDTNHGVDQKRDSPKDGDAVCNPGDALVDRSVMISKSGFEAHVDGNTESTDNLDLLTAADEMRGAQNVKEEIIEKIKVHYQMEDPSYLGSHQPSKISQEVAGCSVELEKLRSLYEESQKETKRDALPPGSIENNVCELRRSITEHSLSSPLPFRREYFDSLDLSQDMFSTPEKPSPRSPSGNYPIRSVDDHHQTFVDISSLNDLDGSGRKVESGAEKSDSDLLDVSDIQALPSAQVFPDRPNRLSYEDLHREHLYLVREVDRLRSELHYYYANSHHQQQGVGKHDSFLDLTEPTELEYLRNVLYKYMLGVETKTLAKVICTVVRFSDDETKKVLDKEDSRASVSLHR